MGRKGGHRSKRQRTDNNRDKAKPDGEKQAAYSDVVQENELMERFYKVGARHRGVDAAEYAVADTVPCLLHRS